MDKNTYTYSEIVSEFNKTVHDYINSCARVANRVCTKENIYNFAQDLYNKNYKDALHVEILNQYKS